MKVNVRPPTTAVQYSQYSAVRHIANKKEVPAVGTTDNRGEPNNELEMIVVMVVVLKNTWFQLIATKKQKRKSKVSSDTAHELS